MFCRYKETVMHALQIVLLCSVVSVAFGGSPLVEAAKSGNHDALKTLLQKKTDANVADPDGATALHWAAYRDDVEASDLLIKAGAKVNAANDLGATPLWLAAQNGGTAMVKHLLEAGANPNQALMAGETPLMVAARGGYAGSMELLLAGGANPNARGSRGQTALMWATSQKHPNAVKVLLAHKADVTLKSDTWTDVMAVPPHGHLPYNKAIPHGGETALMFAARVGDLESARQLVAAGANVNDADAWGVSATTLAAHSGFTDLVLFLLDNDADPNLTPNGFTALQEAVMRRDEKMVAALLEHKADPNFPVKTWTPTRRSSNDFYFDPSLIGATPYWLAARFAEPGVMRMLVQNGADPKFVHNADWVAEQAFGSVPRKEMVNALGAAVGMLRVTPWVEIPREQREALTLEAVKLAVEGGSDVNLVNTDGRTPLDAAKSLGYKSVIDYLTEKGAKGGVAPATQTPGRGRGR
jgi:uncharacterized protein